MAQPFAGGFTETETRRAAERYGLDFAREEFSLDALRVGMNHEREHGDVSKAATVMLKIALAHLREDSEYYSKLATIEKSEVVSLRKAGQPIPYLVKAAGFAPGTALQGKGGGAGPLFNTPEMPDFKYIYSMPEGDARLEDEEDAAANRRRSTRRGAAELHAGQHGKPVKPVMRSEDADVPTLIVKRRQPANVDRERIFAKMSKQRGPAGWTPVGSKGGYKSPTKNAKGKHDYWYPGQQMPKGAKKHADPTVGAKHPGRAHGDMTRTQLVAAVIDNKLMGDAARHVVEDLAPSSLHALVRNWQDTKKDDPVERYKAKQAAKIDMEQLLSEYGRDITIETRDKLFRAVKPGDQFSFGGTWVEMDHRAGQSAVPWTHQRSYQTVTAAEVKTSVRGINIMLKERRGGVDVKEMVITGRTSDRGMAYQLRRIDTSQEGTKFTGERALNNISHVTASTEGLQKRFAAVMSEMKPKMKAEKARKAKAAADHSERVARDQAREDEYSANARAENDKQNAAAAKDSAAIAALMPDSPFKGKRDSNRYDAALPWLRGKVNSPDGLIATAARRAGVGGDPAALAKMTPSKMAAHFAKNGTDPFWTGVATAAAAFKRTASGKKQAAASKKAGAAKAASQKKIRPAVTSAFKRHDPLGGAPARTAEGQVFVARMVAGHEWAEKAKLDPAKALKMAASKTAGWRDGRLGKDKDKNLGQIMFAYDSSAKEGREHIGAFWGGVYQWATQQMKKSAPRVYFSLGSQ